MSSSGAIDVSEPYYPERVGVPGAASYPDAPGHDRAAEYQRWLAAQRRKDARPIDSRLHFHAYVQWLCFSQWRALRAHT